MVAEGSSAVVVVGTNLPRSMALVELREGERAEDEVVLSKLRASVAAANARRASPPPAAAPKTEESDAGRAWSPSSSPSSAVTSRSQARQAIVSLTGVPGGIAGGQGEAEPPAPEKRAAAGGAAGGAGVENIDDGPAAAAGAVGGLCWRRPPGVPRPYPAEGKGC